MPNSPKGKKRIVLDKFLILSAIICITFAILMIALYLKNAEIFANSAYQMKENYTSTETNTWDISENEDGSVIATLDENGLLTISGIGNMKDWSNSTSAPWYNVKTQINNIKLENGVTNIGEYAFSSCESLISIEMPQSITSIGWYAFYGCESLRYIEIPNGVSRIGAYAFSSCSSLTSIKIGSSVSSISNNAFFNCKSLNSIEVNESNTTYQVVNEVLYSKDGTKIIKYPEGKEDKTYSIPDGVIDIGKYAFSYCRNLTNIQMSNSVTSILGSAFQHCDSLINIQISSNLNYIGDKAFFACTSLTGIDIPSYVTSIGDSAFSNCESLTNIDIPSSVTNIGSQAFSGCENIRYIEIPNGVTRIGSNAFSHCYNLTSIQIPSSVTFIGEEAFVRCDSLTNINVNESNTTYKDINGVLYSKDGTKIIKYPEGKEDSSYTMLDGVICIENYAFAYCNDLAIIGIPSSVTSIGNYAFYVCTSLKNIEISNNVTNIGNYAFCLCEIKIGTNNNIIELPDLLKRVQDETDILYSSQELVLTNCTIEEEKLKIDEGKTFAKVKINDGKLYGLSYLISYNTWDVSKQGDGSVIATIDSNGILTVSGTGDMKDYAYNATPWYIIKTQIESISIEEGVTSIGEDSFIACTNLTNIKIPSTVTKIGAHAFESCISLTSIEISRNVTIIGDGALYNCESLTNIDVDENNINYKDVNGVLYSKDGTKIIKYPEGKGDSNYTILDGVTCIEDNTFAYCDNLANIEIVNGVTSIGYNAFKNCTNLISIEIPSSVTTIKQSIFEGCNNLTSIEVDKNNKNYCDDNGVLYKKDKTEIIKYPVKKSDMEYTILSGVIKIADEAFANNIALTNIEIPSSVTTIGKHAFSLCENLINIEIPTSVTNIGSGAFAWNVNLKSIIISNSVTSIADGVFNNCYSLTIICKSGTVAETYAIENDIQYVIDDITPTLTLSSEATVNTVIVNSEAVDEISGIEEDSYKYNIRNENETYGEVITSGTSHTFTNLKSNTKYIIKVEVSDKVGNTVSKEIEVLTLKSNKITTSAYNVDEENLIIKGIQAKTTVEQLKSNLQSEMSYKIIDKTGQVISNTSNVGTGYKIKLEDDKIYTIVIIGDSNGDGQADIKDILAINKHRLNKANLTAEYLQASDVNEDGKTDIKDILQINKFRLGKIKEL